MYSVMIVDDEKLIREELRQMIDFESYGFHVSAVARNGEEAYEQLQKQEIDLILLDIDMPILDGLGFLNKIQGTSHEGILTIILSGHSDFAYAKEAMRHGIQHYLTKPVNENELMTILGGLKRVLDKKQQQCEVDKIHKDCEQLKKIYHTGGVSVGFEQYTLLTIIVLSHEHMIHPIYQVIQEVTMDLFGHTKIINKGFLYLYLVSDSVIQRYTHECTFEQAIQDKLRLQGIRVGVCLSKGVLDVREQSFAMGYHTTIEKYLTQQFYERIKVAMLPDEVEKLKYRQLMDQLIMQLREYILLKEEEKSNGILEQIVTISCKCIYRIEEIYSLTERLFYLCTNVIALENKTGESKHLAKIVLQEAPVFITYSIWVRCMKQLLQDTFKILEQNRALIQMGIYGEIITYVHKHYHTGITVKEVSDKFYVNANYLGRVFQKVVGKSFKQYITELRMAQAKVLLLQTDKKIYEIASEVGYTESKYFIAKFTQEEGKSPVEYRKSKV